MKQERRKLPGKAIIKGEKIAVIFKNMKVFVAFFFQDDRGCREN